jgi:hypothetical protein
MKTYLNTKRWSLTILAWYQCHYNISSKSYTSLRNFAVIHCHYYALNRNKMQTMLRSQKKTRQGKQPHLCLPPDLVSQGSAHQPQLDLEDEHATFCSDKTCVWNIAAIEQLDKLFGKTNLNFLNPTLSSKMISCVPNVCNMIVLFLHQKTIHHSTCWRSWIKNQNTLRENKYKLTTLLLYTKISNFSISNYQARKVCPVPYVELHNQGEIGKRRVCKAH